MQNLYKKLKDYNIEDAVKIEETDRQFIALKKLINNKENKELFLVLIIANSLICYQLSWKGEDYWEELCEYFWNKQLDKNNLINEFIIFLKQSKNNKRFINIKIKRLEKLKSFLGDFEWKWEYYYNNMKKLRDDLSIIMNQKH